jgi:hypothetical protein
MPRVDANGRVMYPHEVGGTVVPDAPAGDLPQEIVAEADPGDISVEKVGLAVDEPRGEGVEAQVGGGVSELIVPGGGEVPKKYQHHKA